MPVKQTSPQLAPNNVSFHRVPEGDISTGLSRSFEYTHHGTTDPSRKKSAKANRLEELHSPLKCKRLRPLKLSEWWNAESKTSRCPSFASFSFRSISLAQTAHEHESAATGIEAGSFAALMAQAMERMHKDMSIAPSGDPDRDFAAMMIPHHQGAVDMAKVELQFGKNPVLRRLAQGIIVEQLQEIEVMQRELRQLSTAPKEP